MNKILTISLLIILFYLSFPTPFVLAANTELGAKVFQANCAGCHAKGGNIVRRGKNLKLKALQRNKLDNLEAIVTLVTNGKNNMSAYGERLTAPEIQAVSAYILERATNNWQ